MTHEALPAGREPVSLRRVGVLDSGALAIASDDGSVTTADGAARISWWVGAEDRWYVPARERSTRSAAVDGLPVIRTETRIPSGSAVAHVYGALVGGDAGGAVVCDVANASPVPVAVALVVETDLPVRVDAHGLSTGGRRLLALTRPAARFAVAADADRLAELLGSPELGSEPPVGSVSGWVALVVPAPHTAHVVVVVDPDPAGEVQRSSVPEPDQVVAGWESLAGQGPVLDLLDGPLTEAFRAAASDVRLGPDIDDVVGICLVAAARARLGDPHGAWPDIVAASRLSGGSGRIGARSGGADRTLAFVEAVNAAVAGGLDPAVLADHEAVVGALAAAAHWLLSPRRASSALPRDAVRRATAVVPELLRLVDQSEAAMHLEAARPSATEGGPARPSDRWRQLLGEVSALGGHVDADGHPSPRDNAAFVAGVLDAVAAPSAVAADGSVELDVFGGWSSEDRGRAVEAHGVPTLAGTVSIALRWHGDRPALLWERTGWPDRPARAVAWSSSRLDPGWRGEGDSGEALLAVPRDDLG